MPALWFLLSVNATTPISQFIWKKMPYSFTSGPMSKYWTCKILQTETQAMQPWKEKKTVLFKDPFSVWTSNFNSTVVRYRWCPALNNSVLQIMKEHQKCLSYFWHMTPWHVTYDIHLYMLLTSKTWPSNFSYWIYGPGPDLTRVQLLQSDLK